MEAKDRKVLIEDILEKWQKILRLSEWKIKVITDVHLHPQEKWGEIKILDNIFRAEMQISTVCPENDLQEVVIHELLHLLTTPIRQFFFKTLQELARLPEGKIIADEATMKDEKLLGNLALSFLEMDKKKKNTDEIAEIIRQQNEIKGEKK